MVRSAFFCAFSAFPASSPSMPKKADSRGECFFFISSAPPAPLIASRGVSLLSLCAGIHAEMSTVRNARRNIRIRTTGCSAKSIFLPPARFAANVPIALTVTKLRTTPSKIPKRIGTAESTTASSMRQVRICLFVAPIPENMPNCLIRLFMDTAKELWITRIREMHTITTIAK